jgi:hypothetical protein
LIRIEADMYINNDWIVEQEDGLVKRIRMPLNKAVEHLRSRFDALGIGAKFIDHIPGYSGGIRIVLSASEIDALADDTVREAIFCLTFNSRNVEVSFC